MWDWDVYHLLTGRGHVLLGRGPRVTETWIILSQATYHLVHGSVP